jgi:hypothetical protein
VAGRDGGGIGASRCRRPSHLMAECEAMMDDLLPREPHELTFSKPIAGAAALQPCTNCGEGMASVYCANCGERQPGHHDLSVAHFAHDVFHELLHVDSKVFTTLRDLVIRPGFVPQEYFAGRKSRYIPPLRLFLTLFAIQFLAFTFYKPAEIYSVSTFKRFDTKGALTTLLTRRATKLHLTMEAYEARVDEHWHHNLSLLQLVNVLGVALVLKVLHRRRYLAEHLVFSAYFLCFSYIVGLLLWPLWATYGLRPGPLQQVIATLTRGVFLVYLFLAQRRFYREGPGITVVKTALLGLGTTAVGVAIMAGSLIVAMLQ